MTTFVPFYGMMALIYTTLLQPAAFDAPPALQPDRAQQQAVVAKPFTELDVQVHLWPGHLARDAQHAKAMAHLCAADARSILRSGTAPNRPFADTSLVG